MLNRINDGYKSKTKYNTLIIKQIIFKKINKKSFFSAKTLHFL
jgi:hypothetical protein